MVYGDTNGHLLAELDRIARALDGYRGTLEGDAGHSQPVDSDAASPPAPATLSLSLPPDTRGDVEARAEGSQTRSVRPRQTPCLDCATRRGVRIVRTAPWESDDLEVVRERLGRISTSAQEIIGTLEARD
jgi:hypothetical protein